jgi:hypothetical protein
VVSKELEKMETKKAIIEEKKITRAERSPYLHDRIDVEHILQDSPHEGDWAKVSSHDENLREDMVLQNLKLLNIIK